MNSITTSIFHDVNKFTSNK